MSSPPYTPFDAESAFKPIAGVTRYIAEEGGSFFEAILRGFFGYHPPMLWAPGGGSYCVICYDCYIYMCIIILISIYTVYIMIIYCSGHE